MRPVETTLSAQLSRKAVYLNQSIYCDRHKQHKQWESYGHLKSACKMGPLVGSMVKKDSSHQIFSRIYKPSKEAVTAWNLKDWKADLSSVANDHEIN